VVRDNLNGGNRTTRDRLIPFCMFTDPELARVGLNETEAKWWCGRGGCDLRYLTGQSFGTRTEVAFSSGGWAVC
jgi:pyruvate/2-oxoglutarate dehydrogenase complex dihydrolipoamide dehydrogenase (E3) component